METSPSSDAVRAFLAERDRACPGCGYNLRGVEQAQCPECGRAIELEVVGKRDRSVLWFLLLALGWVLVASGMNGTRAGMEVWRQSDPSPAAQWANLFTLPNTAPPRMMTQRWQTSGGALTFRSNIQAMVTINGVTMAPPPPPPPPGRRWGNVSTMTWVGFGWWVVLFLGALNFLLALWFVTKRRGPEQLRMLVPVAGFLFLCYAGWHIVTFVRELTA